MRERECNRLLSQAISFYGEPGKKILSSSSESLNQVKINTKKYKNILQEKDLHQLIRNITEKSVISVDTETTSLNPQEAELVGVSLCYAPNVSFYIPIGHKNIKGLEKNFVINELKSVFEDASIKKVGQNIKYDYIILKKYGIELVSMEDTMLLSYTLDAGNNRHNMDTLAELHLGHNTISYKDVVGSGKKKLNFSDIELEKATEYAAEDADVTLRLYNILSKRVENENLIKIYEVFEKPMIKILSKLETHGIKVDDNYLKSLSKNFNQDYLKLKKKFIKSQEKSLTSAHLNNWVKLSTMI